MDSSVLKSVLLGLLENDAVFIDKFNNRVLPNGRLEVFCDDVEDPLLIVFCLFDQFFQVKQLIYLMINLLLKVK